MGGGLIWRIRGCRAWSGIAWTHIQSLVVDKDLADQLRELWNAGVITDDLAILAWCILAANNDYGR